MKLIFLGRYRELAGSVNPEQVLPAQVRDLSALKIWLAQSWPELRLALENSCAVVINQIVVRDPLHPIADNDEIAFLPPMSGG